MLRRSIIADMDPDHNIQTGFDVKRNPRLHLFRTTVRDTVQSRSGRALVELHPSQAQGSPVSGLFPSPGQTRREQRLMRATTVMTLHSDSETDLASSAESQDEEETFDHEDASLFFDQGLTSIPTSSSDGHLFNSGMDFGIGAGHFDVHRDMDTSLEGNARNLIWHASGSSDEHQDEHDSEGTPLDHYIHFNQDSDPAQGEEEEDEGDADDSSMDSGQYPMKDALGSYLLAPMGFADDDEDDEDDDEDEHGIGHPSGEGARRPSGMEGYVAAAERFQIFAGVNEFDESDQIGLGDHDHPYQVISKSKRRDQERILESKRRQGKLLLVSLLDNFCQLYDHSPERNRKLFYVICKTLSNMGIIDEEYLEEMSAVRSSYQRAFRSLVLSALTSIKQEQMILESRRIMAPPSTPIEPKDKQKGSRGADMTSSHSGQSISDSFTSKGMMPSAYLHTPPTATTKFPSAADMMRTLSFGDMFDNDPTRYKHDFVEILKLGKGGFASVFKARNKLDGIEYAIKKIRLRGGSKVRYEKIFREIKFLARLDHKNVIRYYSSWLEHADYPVSRREMYGGDVDTNGDLEDEYDDDDDDEYGDGDDYDHTNTNTMNAQNEYTSSYGQARRTSIDYFDSHSEQHSAISEDLSMGIVFGGSDDTNDPEGDHDGVEFGEDSINIGDRSAEHSFSDASHLRIGNKTLLQGVHAAHGTEDMERTHSTSSTVTSRSIPVAKQPVHRRKHKSPTVSREMQDTVLAWEESETSSQPKSNLKDTSYHSLSTSLSALSSSIEEIQRSFPPSYSGTSLGSRYGRHATSKDSPIDTLEDGQDFRPFSFPIMRESNKTEFMGGGLGSLHGLSQSRSERDSRRSLRSSTGQLVTRDLTLFIQMQLCQTTLKDYLVYRNERPSISKRSHGNGHRHSSKGGRCGILSSLETMGEQKTQSTPASPQEQTCHTDLVDPAVNQHIFRAIVEGVAYCHDQGMIHRDLKPGNIFLGAPPGTEHQRSQQQQAMDDDICSLVAPTISGPLGVTSVTSQGIDHSLSTILPLSSPQYALTKEQIQEELFMNIESMVPKIGDFGLVTDMEGGVNANGEGVETASDAVSPSKPLMRRHSSSVTAGSRSSRTRTTAVGTVTYASPEQLARPNLGYDQKADIYSLGIIFFELFHPFSTLMERHAVLRTLRNGELPVDFVSRWPKEAAFVLWLTADDPRMRPSAREILAFDLIRKPKDDSPLASDLHANGEKPSMLQKHSSDDASILISGMESSKSDAMAARLPLRGLGLSTPGDVLGEPSARVICEPCQVNCRCAESSPSIKTEKSKRGGTRSKSKTRNSKTTTKDPAIVAGLKPTEDSEKVKRLEQSLAAMRSENRALLDRIQALEYEKELGWQSSAP